MKAVKRKEVEKAIRENVSPRRLVLNVIRSAVAHYQHLCQIVLIYITWCFQKKPKCFIKITELSWPSVPLREKNRVGLEFCDSFACKNVHFICKYFGVFFILHLLLNLKYFRISFPKVTNILRILLVWIHLLQELCCHPVGAVKKNKEFFVSLQLFQERSSVLVSWGQLADLDLQVELGWRLDQLLHSHQAWKTMNLFDVARLMVTSDPCGNQGLRPGCPPPPTLQSPSPYKDISAFSSWHLGGEK